MPEVFHGRELPIKLYRDGDKWCALLGENIQEGVAAFAINPVNAVADLMRILNSPSQITSVTQEQIDALLDVSQTQEQVFWGKELVVSYRLPCGFTILGRAACVDPASFDLEIGRKFARENAANQLWQLEGYRLQLEVGPLESTSELQDSIEHDPIDEIIKAMISVERTGAHPLLTDASLLLEQAKIKVAAYKLTKFTAETDG